MLKLARPNFARRLCRQAGRQTVTGSSSWPKTTTSDQVNASNIRATSRFRYVDIDMSLLIRVLVIFLFLCRSSNHRRYSTVDNMHLIFDFDGTITQKDTIGVLVNSALDWHKERGQDLGPRWDHAVATYIEDTKALKESFKPIEADRRSLDDEREFLAVQYEVDEASLNRVSASGIFANITALDYYRFGQEGVDSGNVVIRPGFQDLVALAAKRGWKVHVISINWSRHFIAGVLGSFDETLIISNDPSIDGRIDAPGFLQRRSTGPQDNWKLEALHHVTANSTDKVMYFGDSVNDIECLLCGGIVIADNEDTSLLRTLRRVGVQTPRLSLQTANANLAWAKDFTEFIKANNLDTPSDIDSRHL